MRHLAYCCIALVWGGWLLAACPAAPPTPDGSREQHQDSGTEPDSWPLQTYQTYQAIPAQAAMPQAPPASAVQPLPSSSINYTSDHFTGPDICSQCHDDIQDDKGADVSLIKHWSSTMMAQAARDPYWLAKVESEIKRAPALKATIESKCTRCHAPMAHVEATKKKQPIALFGDGFLNKSNPLFHLALDGVSCTLCHQIQATPQMGTLDGFSGKFSIQSFSDPGQRKIYGPYKDPLPEPMTSNAGYIPTGAEHIRQSKYCASCHVLKTAFVDAKGQIVPKSEKDYFPEQMAYLEWKRSNYANETYGVHSCQSCHMKRSDGVALSFGPPWITKRDDFRQHLFVGGNRFMLSLLNEHRDILGIRADQFAQTIARTQELLKTAAKLSIVGQRFWGGTLQFGVKIYSHTGHKLPTGYPSRRVFLHVTVKNSQGKVVFESGKSLESGHIVGVDADLDASKYEPHYDVITQPDQVQVYESIMSNTDGAVTYTLLRAARYLKDNRIVPIGFTKQGAPKDIQVVGKASEDPNFTAGTDTVTYKIAGLPRDEYTVTVALNYQSISYRMALDLFRDKDGPAVGRFLYMYKRAKRYIDTIASTSFFLSAKK